ncbi:hypothetical protein Tco_0060197, partial [Tanacetum coccineum]
MSFLTSLYSPGNILDRVDIDNLTIEQYLRLTQESQTPKKIEDVTIAEYLEYEKKVNENHIRNTKSYLLTYFDKSTPTQDPIWEFSHYFGPNQPGAESDCDSEDMDEEVEYITDDEVFMSWKKVHIFYIGLDIPTRKILDSNGFIPLMTPTQALESIQVMADHSHDWYDETTTKERINDVMAIYVISVSSYLSEDSVGTPAVRVILFGTIPTIIPDTTPSVIPPTTHIDTTRIPTISPIIPSSPDYTPASPNYSPASDTEFDPSEDPSSDHLPPLPATSLFLSSTNDSSDSDIPDTPPSPTHGTPFTDTTLSTQRSPTTSGALRLHMMTARKRVRLMPTHRLSVRHSVDYSSSDHFSSDDSSSSSSSETSSNSSADALSEIASSRSSFDHSLPASPLGTRSSHHLCSLVPSVQRSSAIFERPSHDSSSASLSRKMSRSTIVFVPLSSPTLGALSYARADLLPSPKRIRSPETATDLEGCSKDSFEPYVPRE